MTEEQIIRQIKLHPVLYNYRLAQYRDLEARNAAWEDIARKTNSNVEDVKTKWGKLRNSYTNALKRRYKKSRDDSIHEVPWKFQKQMHFLLPHLKYRTNKIRPSVQIELEADDDVKNESRSSFNDEYEVQYDRPESPDSSPKYVSPIEDDIPTFTPANSQNKMDSIFLKEFANVIDTPTENNKRVPEMDENDYFFLSMSKILKKLPKEDQMDIKFELHKLIYEAEKKQLKSNGLDTL